MITRISIGWEGAKKIDALSREKWQRLKEDIPQLRLGNWTETMTEPDSWYRYDEDMYLDTRQLPVLQELEIVYSTKAIKNSYMVATPKIDGQPGETVNINIALPNIGLLMVDEVTWRDDECTQAIQSMLDEGWRILAICPPNGARRPDYILGRTKK